MAKKKDSIDYSKVQRYDTVEKTWYEETYREMGECSYGSYVRYEDYVKLLEDKTPPRLPASYSDVVKILKSEIEKLEAETARVFEKKDMINYGYALCQYKQAEILESAIDMIKYEIFVD